MRTLLKYLAPYKGMVLLALLLAAINQTFSMLDPYLFGQMLDKFGVHPKEKGEYVIKKDQQEDGTLQHEKKYERSGDRKQAEFAWGLTGFLGMLIGVAMVSRIAKAFQDYCGNVIVQKFGATIFTIGLKHSMALTFRDFGDQRSGETLSILTKVRVDPEKFILSFINVLFGIIVGVVFVSIYSFRLHWSIMPLYVGGMI